jgi:hypothetical protein
MGALQQNSRQEGHMVEQLGYVDASTIPWGVLASPTTGRIAYKVPNVTVLANCFRRDAYFLSQREQAAVRKALWDSVEVLHQE